MKQSFEPILSDLGPAIAWLADKGIPATRLAALLGTSPGHIRLLAYRARHKIIGQDLPTSIDYPFDVEPSSALREKLGIRPHPDEVILTRKKRAAMDLLEQEIKTRVLSYSSEYRFVEGAASLRALRPLVGYAANARLIGLHAELHKQTAWFCVHSGLAASALKEAEKAIELAAVARFEAGARRSSNGYMQQAIDASLIASQALLIAHQPGAALRYLDLACHASEGIRIPIGSDQLRQRGDAYFQLKIDDEARKFYRQAAETMQRLGEARNEAHVLMYGPRQSNLLDPLDWDRAQEIF